MKKLVLKKNTALTTSSYTIKYTELLNEAQQRAVFHTDGPALVLAGAGTGKTRTLIYRVARLVEDGVDPSSILLLTFTRKSANEMLHRAAQLLDGRCSKVAGGTFHAFSYLVTKRYGIQNTAHNDGEIVVSKNTRIPALEAQENTAPPVSILDQSDAEDVMNLVRGTFDVAHLKKRFPQKKMLLSMYSKAINTSTPLVDILGQHYPAFSDQFDTIGAVIRAYNQYKAEHSLVDYDDLLLRLLAYTRHPEIGGILRKQYRYVMVDEYQDTNALQHQIILGLSGHNGNVMAVGDDAQSIYSFRGSDVRNIHSYPDSFSSCEIIRLEENYRSSQEILNLCNGIIVDAPQMFEKQLRAHNNKTGEQPILIACTNDKQQTQFVVQQILEQLEQGFLLQDIAVLFRSGFLSFDLEIALNNANIPFRKFGGLKFSEAAHVKDILAMLRVSANPRDAIAWYRILLLQKGVGPKTAQKTLQDIIAGNSPQISAQILDFIKSIGKLSEIKDAAERCSKAVEIYQPLCERNYDDFSKRLRELDTIIAICSRYTTTEDFLLDVALEPPTEHINDIEKDDKQNDFLTLSTIHSAKGLEWKTVYVISVNEGRIPSARSAESEATLEEERRLLYVACTRAKEHLYLTYPTVMSEWEHVDVLGRPSRFLDNIDADVCPMYVLTDQEESDEY